MLNIKKIYLKKSQPKAGFTLLEVLVAMLIATFFVVGSMQALVLATALRIKAQEKQRANQLIQEDIEQIQFAAQDLDLDHSLCSATAYDTDAGTDPTDTPPVVDSYAQSLWVNLPSEPADKQLLDGEGKTYRLSRFVDTTNSTAKVLKINFSVQEWDEDESKLVGDVIATDYIAVIPNAAIQCPN